MRRFTRHAAALAAAGLAVAGGIAAAGVAAAAELDWVAKGAVTPVHDQGLCPDSEGYATAGALEGPQQIKTGVLHDYVYAPEYEPQSPFPGQHSVLCLPAYYTRPETHQPAAAWQHVKSGDETDLLRAVNLGPVLAEINASSLSFLTYRQGVYDDPTCSTTHLNQAVLVVGYGTENRQDYWLVKNSWGTGWGEAGYIKIARNHNVCGIAEEAYYAIA